MSANMAPSFAASAFLDVVFAKSDCGFDLLLALVNVYSTLPDSPTNIPLHHADLLALESVEFLRSRRHYVVRRRDVSLLVPVLSISRCPRT